MKFASRVAFRLFAVLLAALSPGLVSDAQASGPDAGGQGPLPIRVEGAFAPQSVIAKALPRRLLPHPEMASQVLLQSVDAARLDAEMMSSTSRPGTPLKIGLDREVPSLRDASETSRMSAWMAAGDSRVAAIRIRSPGAVGVRLGLRGESLPAAAVLRFYAPDADRVFEVSGREILDAVGRNIDAGEVGDEALTWWSPIIDGPEAVLEIEVPSGISPAEVRFAIPRISHIFASPLDTRDLQAKVGQSGACNLDSTCSTATWGNESLATARIVFTDTGGSFLCTGTLINDSNPSTSIPYFLTANHCISTQAAASSLQSYWFYRSSSCNSGVLNAGVQTLTTGATLLYASSTTDTSFMRLNSAAPGGAYFSGWTSDLPSLVASDASATGIHNPGGDLQKISFGSLTAWLTCPTSGGSGYLCTSTTPAAADHVQVVWNQGVTEGGSSGSGLWHAVGGSHYLVGQLHGGLSFCSTPAGPDQYGRFDVAYNTALRQWLGPPGAATLINPSDTISGTPTYSWNAVASATYYFLYVSTGALTYYSPADAGCAAGTGTCSITGLPLVNGSYAWLIIAWNPAGLGPASSAKAFTVSSTALPMATTPIAPSGAITGAPTYRWSAVSNASVYFLYVNDVLTWHYPADVGCGTGLGSCSLAGAALPPGSYTWYLVPWNSNGLGTWSGLGFTVQ